MEVIKIQNLTKTFGEHIIFDKLNMTINQGEMVAIVGKSGTGKTTLLNILGLIDTFDKGIYSFFEQENIAPNSKKAIIAIRNHINYLFQNFALIDDESILSNLLLGLEFEKLSKEGKIEKIKEVLNRVNIKHDIKTKVSSLSGGEQQRIAIARIMLKKGDLILADEPTGSLDEDNREIVLNLLKELSKEGKTIIIVTHDNYVASQCDRRIRL